MREIEVKARLRDEKLFIKNAVKLGIVFGEPVIQDDTTYGTTIPKDNPDWNIFRIRKQGSKTILTMKFKASTRSRDHHEYETVIEDAGQMAAILERLGYTFGVRIRKTRRTAKYKDLELCLDEIDDLGAFVEVEKLADERADVDAIQSELWDLLVNLGVNANDRIHKGYDTLVYEYNNTIG